MRYSVVLLYFFMNFLCYQNTDYPYGWDMGCPLWVNSSPPSAEYMHQCLGSAMVQIVACRLFDAKTLSKPMPGYFQLDHYEQSSVKYKTFHSLKCIWKFCLPKWRPFCPGGDELNSLAMFCLSHYSAVCKLSCYTCYIVKQTRGMSVMFHFSTDLIQRFLSVYLLKSQYNFSLFSEVLLHLHS